MSRQLVEQIRLHHRGRNFHFVCYEGNPGNPRRNLPATAPAWFLMSEGTRWEVMAFQPDQERDVLDKQFAAWLDDHVFRTTT